MALFPLCSDESILDQNSKDHGMYNESNKAFNQHILTEVKNVNTLIIS